MITGLIRGYKSKAGPINDRASGKLLHDAVRKANGAAPRSDMGDLSFSTCCD